MKTMSGDMLKDRSLDTDRQMKQTFDTARRFDGNYEINLLPCKFQFHARVDDKKSYRSLSYPFRCRTAVDGELLRLHLQFLAIFRIYFPEKNRTALKISCN